MRLFIVALLLLVGVFSVRSQQLKVTDKKGYVTAIVDQPTGLITIKRAPGTNQDATLSGPQRSFLYVMIGDRIFTNNNVGTNISTDPRYGGFLSDGVSQKISDTIRTTWANKNSADIIQDVYPVSFNASGQIVIRWKVKNKQNNTPVWGQVKFLLDVAVSEDSDHPPVLTRYGYRPIWEQYNSASTFGVPWMFAAFEHKMPNDPTYDPGRTGVGYTQDVNYKLGLKSPLVMTMGDWGAPIGAALVDNLWGVSPQIPWGTDFQDPAILLEWDGAGIQGGKELEIARTSYGTGEFSICNNQILGIVFAPSYFGKRQPENIESGFVDYYGFNKYSPLPQDPNYGPPVTDGYLTLHAGPNIRITKPDTGNIGQKEQRQQIGVNGYIPQYGVGFASWKIVADKPTGCTGSIDSWLMLTSEPRFGPNNVIVDTCEFSLKIDCEKADVFAPATTNVVVGKVFPYTTTFSVADNATNDTGLDSITWAPTPGSNTDVSKFTIGYSPALTPCSKSSHSVAIRQLDSTKAGCFDFRLKDCAGNDTIYTICFQKRGGVPTPDTLPPVISVTSKFVGTKAIAPCDGICYFLDVTETRSFDVGLKSVVAMNPTNMSIITTEILPGATSHQLTICVQDSLVDGSVTIRATDTVGNFTDSLFCYDVQGSDVSAPQMANDIELIGNPASSHTLLRIRLGESQTVTVRVLDMTGRTLRTILPGRVEAGSTDIDIETADLSAGTYYLVAEWSGRQYAKKLQVVK